MKERLNTMLKELSIPVEILKVDASKEKKYIREIYEINNEDTIEETIAILKEERRNLRKVYTVFFSLESRVKNTLLSAYKEHEPLGNYKKVEEWVPSGGMFLGGCGDYEEVERLIEFEPETNYDKDTNQFYKEFKVPNNKNLVLRATEYFIELNNKIEGV